ncbi:LysR family transcriptional regulator [Thalassotalea sp. PLHSN55]|uniref:LysR family transcriptional regulator n=1 Tax=Thalassotalea sp. PLHSN55 TaxID=3435888 RepID=UPI003F83B68C
MAVFLSASGHSWLNKTVIVISIELAKPLKHSQIAMNRIDLNLLLTLQVLLKVKSTTLAAEELHTSQSAVSRSLVRLRDMMGDKLLVRKGQSLALTVKGEQLAQELPQLLSQLNNLVENKPFEPTQSQERITIAMNASIAEWVVPSFSQYLAEQAPGIELTIEDWDSSTPKNLAQGAIRMGLNYFPLELPKSFIQHKLGQDNFVLVCRKDHPLSQEKIITVQHVQQYDLAVHVMKDWNDAAPKAEQELLKHNIDINVKIRCSHLSIILRTLLESDLIFFSAKLAAQQLDERFISIPFSTEITQPSGDIGLFYANHYSSDSMTIWLEKSLKKVIRNYM